ncbi:helix-turn-helix domain-containing protein [Acidaminobacter sp. JC074]|uniref:AraC family transcriptional regulator n=1 Tax=Acidaminobacter sp. JC074 TaxID=2530199 RepID=UPI001F1034C8|nr:AraC family transcriptional regulator [Acidaminobacter sp. JC074]MCH4885973.1 helix-turn-helix domain-containing protein [Acidaminobacter sp. JC074]
MLGNSQFFIANRSTINVSLVIHYCGSEICSKGKTWGPRLVDHYILYYVYEGQGTLYVDDKKFKVKSGQMFLIAPNTLMGYKASETSPFKLSWIGFFGYQAEGYLNRAGLSVDHPVVTLGEDDFIYDHYKKILETANIRHNRYCKMVAILYMIISHLIDIKTVKEEDIPLEVTTELYLRKALEYADMNYAYNVTVQEMAEYVGIDRKYLYQIFRNSLNKSPQQYLIDYRMYRATELLKDSSLSIADVSRSVGYDNAFHFSKLFKKNIGQAPSDYRKKLHRVEPVEASDIQTAKAYEHIIEQKDDLISELKEMIQNYKMLLRRENIE